MGMDFHKAYDAETVVLNIEGDRLEVPSLKTYEEAVEKLGFPPFLRASLAERGYYRLTPVQEATMPLMGARADFLASSFTGSGKTAAYLLPILAALEKLSRLRPGALVAAHYKLRDGRRSTQLGVAHVRGLRDDDVALEFERDSGERHRQFVPVEWVMGSPDPQPPAPWQGPATPRALVLVPTRELAVQVSEEARKFTKYSWLRSAALYGSKGIRSQFRDLAHGADVLVATPGLLVDALHRGVVKLDKVKYLVLDEADRMMDYGFGNQLEEITTGAGMPTAVTGRHTSFWSATIPPSVRELVEGFLGEACIWVDCTGGQSNAVPRNIRHVLIDARPLHRNMRTFEPGVPVVLQDGRKGTIDSKRGRTYRVKFKDGPLDKFKMIKKGRIHLSTLHTEDIKLEKMKQLRDILASQELKRASVIVFCKSRDVAQEVWAYLSEHFAETALCHGAQSESYRRMNVARLREGKADVLVATDLASRGLDLPDVTHVINYEVPSAIDDFVHRCGRCGRIGKQGMAITFVTGRELIFNQLRRTLGQNMRLPRWFNLTGMSQAWRHRKTKLPFSKATSVLDLKTGATREEKDAYIRRKRDQFLKHQLKRTEKMIMLERGEMTYDDDKDDEEESQSDEIVVRVGEDDDRFYQKGNNYL